MRYVHVHTFNVHDIVHVTCTDEYLHVHVHVGIVVPDMYLVMQLCLVLFLGI